MRSRLMLDNIRFLRTVSTAASMILPPAGSMTVRPATTCFVRRKAFAPPAVTTPPSVTHSSDCVTPGETAAAQFPLPSNTNAVISNVSVSGTMVGSRLNGGNGIVSVIVPVRGGRNSRVKLRVSVAVRPGEDARTVTPARMMPAPCGSSAAVMTTRTESLVSSRSGDTTVIDNDGRVMS